MRFWLLILFALAQPALAAKPNCLFKGLLKGSIFEQEAPILVSKGELSLPITFSHDSELSRGDVIGLLPRDEETQAALRKILAGQDFDLSGLAKTFGYSEKQARAFVLRKGVDPNHERTRFNLLELKPAYIDGVSTWDFRKNLIPLFAAELKRRGYDFNVVEEVMGSIEVQHPTCEASPKKFFTDLARAEKEFKNLQTHVHIGLPADVIDKPTAIRIAQALETHMILSSVAHYPEDDVEMKWHEYSPLRDQDTGNNYGAFQQRGPLRLLESRFTSPHKAHDLEIRMAESHEQELHFADFAVRLAQNHANLRVVDCPKSAVKDPISGNLSGALRYGGLQLLAGQPQHKALAEKMIAYSDRIEAEADISPALRKEIGEFLQENDIPQKLDVNAFLQK